MPNFQQFATGQATAPTGTATALAESPANPVQGEGFMVILEALKANTASIFYGPSGVTATTGKELAPGAQDVIYVNNLDQIFLISGTAGQKVSWVMTEFY